MRLCACACEGKASEPPSTGPEIISVAATRILTKEAETDFCDGRRAGVSDGGPWRCRELFPGHLFPKEGTAPSGR